MPTPSAVPSAAPSRAPSAPVSSAVSQQAQAEFNALKESLGHIVSWELTSNRYDVLPLRFSEAGNEKQAHALQAALR